MELMLELLLVEKVVSRGADLHDDERDFPRDGGVLFNTQTVGDVNVGERENLENLFVHLVGILPLLKSKSLCAV